MARPAWLSRTARSFGHRRLALPGESKPSVIEAPSATTEPPTGLELLLARRLDFDRVPPAERPGNLYRLGCRVLGRAAVQAEGAAGEGDVNFHQILVNAAGRGGGHPGEHG